jgi:replication factor C subunit 1
MHHEKGHSTLHAMLRDPFLMTSRHADSQLWVDKWKPRSAAHLVGNPSNLNLMRQWLSNWHSVHIHGAEPAAAPGARGAKLDMTKKALLLAGPPGTGKTTAAQIISKCAFSRLCSVRDSCLTAYKESGLLSAWSLGSGSASNLRAEDANVQCCTCREMGFDVVEVNASDTRNKSDTKYKEGIGGKTSNRMKELVTNTAIGFANGKTQRGKQVLIMDEVDGMSGAPPLHRRSHALYFQSIHRLTVLQPGAGHGLGRHFWSHVIAW